MPEGLGTIDVVARLQQRADSLSRSERKIANILMEEMDFTVSASIVELADRATVSPPTVTRFCHRLGCKNFADFKLSLARSAFVGARFYREERRARAPRDIADNIIAKAQSALFVLNETLDYQALEASARTVARGSAVYAFGAGGTSTIIAQELQNRLFRLGLTVIPSSDHTMQLMMAAAAGPDDVIVASSVSGRNDELARALSVARDNGVPSIALTKPDTMVAEAAARTIAIDIAEGDDVRRPSSARYAFLAVVDILAHLVALMRQDQASETLRRIKRQLVTHRDEDDRQIMGD